MTLLMAISGWLAVGLIAYLVFALIRPEKF